MYREVFFYSLNVRFLGVKGVKQKEYPPNRKARGIWFMR